MHDELKQFALLAEFGEEDREALGELLEEQILAAGRRIFSEGNEADGLVLIVEGSARLESRRTGDSEVIGAGNTLGSLSLVALGPREITAKATTACTLLRLSRESFRRLVEDHPRTACHLLEAVVADLSSLVRRDLDRLAL